MEKSKAYNEDLKKNLIIDLTFRLAIDIVRFVEVLEQTKKYAVANQLIRCGTSVGANSREAQNSESRADFIHKMKIAAKEADETEYWLDICQTAEHYPDCKELLTQIKSIRKVLSKIISTSRKRLDT